MVKVLMILSIFLAPVVSTAQFNRASLQATGLTCAMCSNAINKALKKLDFVASVDADISNSTFHIKFKDDEAVKVEELRKAVEDAGFFIGGLSLTGKFDGLKIADNAEVTIGKENFRFIEVENKVLQGEATLKVLNKEFVTSKQYKKYSAATRKKLENNKDKVFHVTM
jgi:copper chaperone CopZ